MQRWDVARNNYLFSAAIYLENTPWYLIVAENVIIYICEVLHRLDIKWLPKNLRADYNGWHGLFHVYVCDPVTQFVFKKTASTRIELPYFFLKELFPEAFLDNDDGLYENDPQKEINEKSAKALDKRFRNAYIKIIEHSKPKL